MKLEINPDRLLSDLRRLAGFGAHLTGVHRPTFSSQDMAARAWIMERMREARLEPELDGIGNILGRAPGARRRLLVGSHSDSQNHAGWLDGAMGVVFALEIARSIAEVAKGATDMSRNASEVSRAANDVSRNANEAARGLRDVTSNIHGVSEATENASHNAQRVNAAAGSLRSIAQELQRLVSPFRVESKET